MTDFWRPERSSAVDHQLRLLAGGCCGEESGPLPPLCEILNLADLESAGYCAGRERHTPFPVARLKITQEAFEADYFDYGIVHRFVSERLREAMGLHATGARFFEVDATMSAPLPRAKNYQVMEVSAVEDMLDLERSEHEPPKRLPGAERDSIFVMRYAFRADAAPRHELFYDRLSSAFLCTEAFAVRVLKSGCTGMSFAHPNRGPDGEVFYRTLRGVEEYVEWDAVNGVEVTKLVTGIN